MPLSLPHLLTRFHNAVHWNLALYVVYRILFTGLSFLLFSRLTTLDYSLWANLNSLTFLILLWTDCGLRKSIPRFCLQFSQDRASHKRFIVMICAAQTALVLLAIPLFVYTLYHLHPTLSSQISPLLLGAACGAFVMEGIANHIRQLYHSHFKQKQYNLIFTSILAAEMVGNFILMMNTHKSADLLLQITIMRGMSKLVVIGVCAYYIPTLYTDENTIADIPQEKNSLTQSFMKHSLLMWGSSVIKSLSERNFITPLLTHIAGPEQANLFKIINDGALFFYRVIPKTVGTTDTLLFTHVEASPDRKMLLPIAFTELTTKIAALCLPFLGILTIFFGFQGVRLFNDSYAFQVFIILVIGYSIESLLSPYERLLEVKRDYRVLMCAYIPYILLIALAYWNSCIAWIGLVGFIACVHGVRLVSIFLMMRIVRRRYDIGFPGKELLGMFVRSAPWYVIGYGIVAYTPIGDCLMRAFAGLMRF